MMSHPTRSHDSGNRHSLVDEEKKVLPGRPFDSGPIDSGPSDFETVKLSELAPDPDAALSEDERARIVCSSFQAKSLDLTIRQDRELLWKLDARLIPWLCLLYLISFLDRTNIGNAKLDGLLESLHMTGGQYNAALSVFFVSYSLAEPLTNVLLKRLRPSIFLPTIMILWGICMTTMGLVHNWSGLMAARFFLGLAEAGLFPGINYYLSCWYKRSEFGIRAAIFFSAAAVAGSFGGLLAAAITKMSGVGNKKGWAWIFILEGLATILIGILSFWMVFDFPDQATFLSDVDRKRVLRRLKSDQQSSAEHEKFKAAYFWASLKDWKTYTSAMIYMGCESVNHPSAHRKRFSFAPISFNHHNFDLGRDILIGLMSVRRRSSICLLTVSSNYRRGRE